MDELILQVLGECSTSEPRKLNFAFLTLQCYILTTYCNYDNKIWHLERRLWFVMVLAVCLFWLFQVRKYWKVFTCRNEMVAKGSWSCRGWQWPCCCCGCSSVCNTNESTVRCLKQLSIDSHFNILLEQCVALSELHLLVALNVPAVPSGYSCLWLCVMDLTSEHCLKQYSHKFASSMFLCQFWKYTRATCATRLASHNRIQSYYQKMNR